VGYPANAAHNLGGDGWAAAHSVRPLIHTESIQVEEKSFTEILASSKKMSEEEIRLWLQNPPVFQGEKKADAVMAQIKLQAIRALASQSAGHKLSDKEWATLVIRRNHQSG
jgi:hypothetical protein